MWPGGDRLAPGARGKVFSNLHSAGRRLGGVGEDDAIAKKITQEDE